MRYVGRAYDPYRRTPPPRMTIFNANRRIIRDHAMDPRD